MEKKPSAYQLSPQDQMSVKYIQEHLESTMGKIPMRAAISWAINQAKLRIEREERRMQKVAQ